MLHPLRESDPSLSPTPDLGIPISTSSSAAWAQVDISNPDSKLLPCPTQFWYAAPSPSSPHMHDMMPSFSVLSDLYVPH